MVWVAIGFLLRLEVLRAHLGLAGEPGLRQEDRDHAEQNGESDHHYGAGTHAPYPLLPTSDLPSLRRSSYSFAGGIELVKRYVVLRLC
jgi:hypothetical protein